VRSPRKVTLLSLYSSGRQVVVYVDERLTAFLEPEVNDAQTVWIVDAHRDDGKPFIVHADEPLTAFLELEGVAGESLRFPNSE
jgi:hypothetical protein